MIAGIGRDTDGKNRGYVDTDILLGQRAFEIDADRKRGEVEKGIFLQEGHHKGDAAVHTFGASVRAVFVFAYLTVDDQHFIRRTGFDSGHDDQKQHKYDEHRDDGDDYAYARCGQAMRD